MQKRRTYKDTIPPYETVSKYQEYWRLVEWMATPSPLRKPATLGEFAKQPTISLHYTTLSRWQRVDGFYRDVRAKIKHDLRGELPDVLYALRNRIFKEGNAKEIKLFLQWVDDFVETEKVEHTVETTMLPSAELRELAEKFELGYRDFLAKKKPAA